MFVSRVSFLILITLLIPLIGCSSKEDAGARAKGQVILNGSPLTQGTVIFNPVGVGSTSYGNISPDGSFEMSTGKSMLGIHPGDYLVSIESWIVGPGDVDAKGNTINDGISRIPRKYTDPRKSNLNATIKGEGTNEFKFVLEGEGEKAGS